MCFSFKFTHKENIKKTNYCAKCSKTFYPPIYCFHDDGNIAFFFFFAFFLHRKAEVNFNELKTKEHIRL